MKGAKKCYKEVKNARLPNAKTFTMRDIDTHENYIFKINNPYVPPLQTGGSPQKDGNGDEKLESLVPQQNNDKFAKIEDDIKLLESRVTIVENTVGTAIYKYNEKTVKTGEDSCVIM
jgi:NACalpha-BTF3-like transcription factor